MSFIFSSGLSATKPTNSPEEIPGIYIPGAISRDVAKQSADNSLQIMELTSMDPSFKAQAAATGINAAKSLLSKKVKQVKVIVKAGYRLMLKDKSVQQ